LQATYGELEINARAWEVRLGGAVIDLTRTEFEILALLASQPREVVPDEEITRQIWGDGWFGDDNNLAVHVSKLRHKLGESGSRPRYIRTVRAVGYRFEPNLDVLYGPGELPRVCETLRGHEDAVELYADSQLRVTAISPRGARVLGFKPDEAIGQRFDLFTDGSWRDHQFALENVEALVSSGVRDWTGRHNVKRSDGTLLEAEFAACLTLDGAGQFEKLHLVFVESRWGLNGPAALARGVSNGGHGRRQAGRSAHRA
jgi:DNA-binding winged helix-turn-helix (wHTH) protein